MKTLVALGTLILALCSPARGQLVLNAGETYIYQFSTLPHLGNFSLTPLSEIGGRFLFTVDAGTFQAGDSFQYEMWEHSLSDGAPLRTGVWDGAPTPQGLFSVSAWNDQQGLIRLTGLSGSVTVNSIQMSSTVVQNSTTYSLYQSTITPVPEPGTLTLFGLALGLLGFTPHRRRAAP